MLLELNQLIPDFLKAYHTVILGKKLCSKRIMSINNKPNKINNN